MRFYSASVPGPYHLQQGLVNQDAVAYAGNEPMAVGAVADGAGSLKYSDEGASLAAVVACEALAQELTAGNSLQASLLIALTVAREQLLSQEFSQEMGCTLVLAGVVGDSWGVGVVGDAFAVVHQDDEHTLITADKFGEYANITKLLTSADWNPKIVTGEGFRAISLASDGLLPVSVTKDGALPGFWRTIVTQAEAGSLDVGKLFSWLQERERLVDDTTLLVLTPEVETDK